MKVLVISLIALLLAACGDSRPPLNEMSRFEFATAYAEAWSSQDPEDLASFYAEDGELIVNGGEPAIGREAVEAKAASFMRDFPDMKVTLVRIVEQGDTVRFYWHWTGTNTGPGGTGRHVDLRGHETWFFDEDGLIIESQGSYDEEEYARQVGTN